MTAELPKGKLSIGASKWMARDPEAFCSAATQIYSVYEFQILCAPCVCYGYPAMQSISRRCSRQKIETIGFRSDFEYYAFITFEFLKVFVNYFRVPFIVYVGRHCGYDRVPHTLLRYALQGVRTYLITCGGREIFYHKFESTLGFEFDAAIKKYVENQLLEII